MGPASRRDTPASAGTESGPFRAPPSHEGRMPGRLTRHGLGGRRDAADAASVAWCAF
jgi:hypothetical protein